ncbi:MAG TPA: hypothetical protein VMU14_19455 [Acidimicrobiales bacterium]|nr:hypothetical protein [Acidimicrobiales bacterium]
MDDDHGVAESDGRTPCPRCGRPASVMTLTRRPCVSLTSCPGCAWRRWALNGEDASIGDVLAVIHGRPLRRSISPGLGAQLRSGPRPEAERGSRLAPIVPLRPRASGRTN